MAPEPNKETGVDRMKKKPEKTAIIAHASSTGYAGAIVAALQQIGSVPISITLIDTIPEKEWNDENAGEGNINAGKQAKRPGFEE
jgi:hypothetical protein